MLLMGDEDRDEIKSSGLSSTKQTSGGYPMSRLEHKGRNRISAYRVAVGTCTQSECPCYSAKTRRSHNCMCAQGFCTGLV
jgi:hypothetical protein